MDETNSNNNVVIPVFKEVDAKSLGSDVGNYAGGLANPYQPGGLEKIQIGTGFTVFNVDQNGMWMGSPRFATAPFRASMSGEVVAKIVNDNGDIISDNIGLNGENNFVPKEVLQATDQTFTDVDWVNSEFLVITILALPRAVRALVHLSISGYHDDVDGRLEFQVLLNNAGTSSVVGGTMALNQVADPTTPQTNSMMFPITLGAGDNTIVVQGRSSNANAGVLTGTTIAARLGVLLLGK